MKLRSKVDVKTFKYVISKCEGPVWLESKFGDRYNLKSTLSQYVAIADLLRDKNEDLEIFASLEEDQARISEMLHILDEKNKDLD